MPLFMLFIPLLCASACSLLLMLLQMKQSGLLFCGGMILMGVRPLSSLSNWRRVRRTGSNFEHAHTYSPLLTAMHVHTN